MKERRGGKMGEKEGRKVRGDIEVTVTVDLDHLMYAV